MRLSVLIADDHPVVLSGLAGLIGVAGDLKLIGQCQDGDEVSRAVVLHAPDLVVLDLRMPGRPTAEIIRDIRSSGCQAKVILLTAAATDVELYEGVMAGVDAIIFKEAAADTLINCLRTVGAGERWPYDRFVSQALEREHERREKWAKLAPMLTARELQIVRLVVQGASNKQIAFELGTAESTIKVHLNSVFRKLDVNSRVEVTRLCLHIEF